MPRSRERILIGIVAWKQAIGLGKPSKASIFSSP
jgi:hypothetical protein